MTKRKIHYWGIPPEASSEFVACMEEVGETYAQPYDPRFPGVGMDEQAVQLLQETRGAIAATTRHPRRVEYEYERAGTASIFMFCDPLAGWRHGNVREQRPKVDWAIELEELLRTRYAKAGKGGLVCDNLNTHPKGACYEAFPPQKARSLLRRLDFRYTPKHSSWLNRAGNELSALPRQCLTDRRLGSIAALREEITGWSHASNTKQRGVDWQFKLDDARCKLKYLYPKILI